MAGPGNHGGTFSRDLNRETNRKAYQGCDLCRDTVHSIRSLNVGAASNPALLEPAPEFHVGLMSEIRDRSRYEIAARRHKEARNHMPRADVG
jgi:hypothetical protein